MRPAKKLALIALLSAMLTASKFALSFAANVETVTLLTAVSAAAFGFGVVMPATLVFTAVDTLIYGFGPWVVSYLIYWPLLAAAFSVCRRAGRGDLCYKLTAVAMTAFFGVLTSLVDTGLFTGFYSGFWTRFSILYVRGLQFYAVHITGNVIAFAVLFSPLKRAVEASLNRRNAVDAGERDLSIDGRKARFKR